METIVDRITTEIISDLRLDVSETDRVRSCVVLIYRKILGYLRREDLPVELEWALKELSMNRYGYLGSEGLKSENFEGGFSVSYKDAETEWNKYKKYFDVFIKKNNYRFI